MNFCYNDRIPTSKCFKKLWSPAHCFYFIITRSATADHLMKLSIHIFHEQSVHLFHSYFSRSQVIRKSNCSKYNSKGSHFSRIYTINDRKNNSILHNNRLTTIKLMLKQRNHASKFLKSDNGFEFPMSNHVWSNFMKFRFSRCFFTLAQTNKWI